MKKVFLTALTILFLFVFSCFADTISTPISTTLNTSTYTAITTGTQDCHGFAIMISDGSDFYIAVDSSGTGEVLIENGLSGVSWPDYVPNRTTVMYCKAVTGTPKLYLFPAKKVNK